MGQGNQGLGGECNCQPGGGQVVESHEMVALQEAIELLDSRNEIENLMKMIKQKKMFKIDILNTSMSQAGEIYFYLAAIACIDGKMKKVEADLLKELGQKLNLPVDFQKAVMKWGINQMNHNQRWSQEQNILNQQKDVLLKAL